MSKLLSIQEAAEVLGVTAQTLRRWDKSGRLIAKRHPINGYRLYDPDELDAIKGLTSAPPKSGARPQLSPRRVPQTHGAYFGHPHARQQLDRLLASGRRLLTLTGAPGIGKTRLAREVVSQRDRVAFTDVSAARDVSDLAAALLAASGFPASELARLGDDMTAVIRNVQAGGIRTVVLDNLEQLLPAAAETLARWVDEAHKITFLVTSREPTRVSGEVVVQVDRLDEADAVMMLTARTEEAGGIAGDPAAAEAIAAFLDGVPLAIELVAPLCAVMGFAGARSQLHSLLDALPAAGPDRPGRQSSLRAALDWSWHLLDPSQQTFFAQLGVFRGPFDLAAVQEIVVTDGRSPAAGALLDLVRKSMLVRVPGHPPAFRMLGPVAEYAAERFTALADAVRQDLAVRHRDFYVRRAIATLDAPGAIKPSATVANLVAAIERTSDGLPACDETLARALRVATYLGALSGHLLALPRQVEVLTTIKDAARDSAPNEVLAEAYDFLTKAQRRLGDYGAATQSVEEGIRLAMGAGDARTEAMLRVRLGTMHRHRGALEDARRECKTALGRLSRDAEPGGYALAQAGLACTYLVSGEPVQARQLLVKAIHTAERTGATRYLAVYVGLRGNVEQDDGNLSAAQTYYRQALRIHRELDDHENIGIFTGYLATVYHERERWEEAHVYYTDALEALEIAPHARFSCLYEGSLGALLAEQGDLAGAAKHLDHAIDRAARYQFGRLDEVLRVHRRHLELASLAATSSAADVRHHLDEILAERSSHAIDSDDLRFAYRRIRAAGLRYIEQARMARSDLQAASDGTWFQVGDERVDISRRKAVRQIFAHLLAMHDTDPQATATTEDLIAVGWPGQRLVGDSGEHRVRVAVWTLRRLGLSNLLVTSEGGYQLRPGLTIHILDS